VKYHYYYHLSVHVPLAAAAVARPLQLHIGMKVLVWLMGACVRTEKKNTRIWPSIAIRVTLYRKQVLAGGRQVNGSQWVRRGRKWNLSSNEINLNAV
jgi:hypothetical protein